LGVECNSSRITIIDQVGHIISRENDRAVLVWDAETEVVLELLIGHITLVNSIAISGDSMHIMSGSEDSTICIWDAHTRDCLLGPLQGHPLMINCVTFLPDSKHMVSGSDDFNIHVWNIETEDAGLKQQARCATEAVQDDNKFNDTPKMANGWILNPSLTLQFCVLSWNRTGL